MKYPFVILIPIILLSSFSFRQTKQEQLIDSVLVANTGKTYSEYLTHFENIDREYNALLDTIRKNIKESNRNKNRTLPTVPNKKYSSKEFPMVQIYKGKKSKDLRNFSVLTFEKIKKVSS